MTEISGAWTRLEKVRRNGAVFSSIAIEIVSLCPQHKSSKSGRSRAMQVRIVLLGLGIAVLAFATKPLIPVGIVFCLLALLIPIEETKKRKILRSLKQSKTTTKSTTNTIDISIDATHFEFVLGGEKFRSKRKAAQVCSTADGKTLVQFKHVSKKRKVWFRSPQKAPEKSEVIGKDKLTDVIDVDAQHLERLRGET